MHCDSPGRQRGRRLASGLLAGLALAGPLLAGTDAGLSLDQAVALATHRSRLVVAADAQTQAARESGVAASRRPDPVLSFGYNDLPVDGPDRLSSTRDDFTMAVVGISQELTRAAKREARAGRAEREVELAQVERQAVVADLQRDAALAWLERSFHESMRELLREQTAQADLQVQAAETLYRRGSGAQADVFAARAAAERLRDALDVVDREVAVATTQLARWLTDQASRPLGARPPLELPAWTQGELAAALAHHPQIATAARREALAGSDVALARADQSADWTVGLSYGRRSAFSNFVSINLAVPLQWDQKNRQDRELAARLAGADAARARREDMQRAHEAEVRARVQEWHSQGERLRRYDTALLPLAGQRAESALAAYRAGSGTLSAVLDARQAALDTRVERLRIERERARVWAQLNYLLPSDDGTPTPLETTR